jgi:hypothetical protein
MSAVGISEAATVCTAVESRPGVQRVADGNQRAASIPRPIWDRDRLELRVGAKIVRQFKIPAPHEEMILAVLEELDWPTRIEDSCLSLDNPLELERALASLNRRQRPQLLDFRLDAAGCGVLWKPIDTVTDVCDV